MSYDHMTPEYKATMLDEHLAKIAEQAAEIARLRRDLAEIGEYGTDEINAAVDLRHEVARQRIELERLGTCTEAGCNSDAVYPICADCDHKNGMEMIRQAKIEVLREVMADGDSISNGGHKAACLRMIEALEATKC